jgi:L-malate glycosyltransferase
MKGAPPPGFDVITSLWRIVVRATLRAYLVALRLAMRLGPAARLPVGGHHVLLTGTFNSDNWILAHLGPLAASPACRRVTMVATSRVPIVDKVEAVYPPRWLQRIAGDVGSRLLMFAVVAARTRPDVVGGFHLLINGLVAALTARATGAQSWYFCVGGITELRDGGVWGENRYFARLRWPDPVVERLLLRATSAFDLIITMGSGAVGELRRRGVTDPRFEVISGGVIDYGPPDHERLCEFDAILVARLVPIKRIELFIESIATLRAIRPQTRAVIVGDGPLRQELSEHARRLGVDDAIMFAGHQDDVRAWLRRARVFVLTSRSEGLALSMMEAMMEGLPAVVPRVGDLGDLVDDGVNGYLIESATSDAFSAHLGQVLSDEPTYRAFSENARAAALRFSVAGATAAWDALLRQSSRER